MNDIFPVADAINAVSRFVAALSIDPSLFAATPLWRFNFRQRCAFDV